MPNIKRIIKNVLKFVLFLGIGLGVLYWVYHKQQAAYSAQCELDGIPQSECSLIDKVLTDFGQANLAWLALIVFLFSLSNIFRAARWNMLLRPLGYRPRFINAFLAIVIGYFANLGLPRMGEFIRATTLSRYESIPVEQAVGTIMVDRAIDMLSFLIVFGLALMLQFHTLADYLSAHARIPGQKLIRNPVFWVSLAIGAGILYGIYRRRERLRHTAVYQRLDRILRGFADGIKTVAQVQNVPLFLLYSFLIWGLYYSMTYLCFFAFPPTSHLGPGAGLLVFVFASLGMIIPSPGGMGTYHAMVVAGLSLFGIDGGDAFSFANIIFFTIQIFGIIIFGLAALLLMPFVNRGYRPLPAKV